jgi:hypothetical protein
MCNHKGIHGTTIVPHTNARKKKYLADWVHSIRKRKACDELASHCVFALNEIPCECKTGQSPRGQLDVRFAELEEFKNTHGTISFLDEEKKNHPKLSTWTAYAKITAIKVLNKEATNSVFTLVPIKKLVDISLAPYYFYTYGPGEQEDEDSDEADAADIWGGRNTEKEQHQGNYDDNIEEEQQPVHEEQQQVDEDQHHGNAEGGG